MTELLKTLCALPGPSGCEDAVRAFVLKKAKPYADALRTDAIGNVMVFRKGRKTLERPVVVCAHMDEVGVIVKKITDDGMIKFGFVGGVALIGIYFVLIVQMVKITFSTKNAFYSYVSTGIIMMILFHAFENIGMSIDLLPLTGVPLPFVSQGGSALIGNMIGVGLILSMKWHNKDYMFSTAGDF